MTGDPAATLVKELIDISGRNVGSTGPNAIACVRALYVAAQAKPAVLRAVWGLILKTCERHEIPAMLVRAVMFIETHLPDGVSILSPRWLNRIQEIGAAELVAAGSADSRLELDS